jgi:hypothetical protein
MAPPKVVPVKWWAAAGALITTFMVYVLMRWVTGPNFAPVDPGPTPLPGWMKVSLIGWQILMPLVWLGTVYQFIVKPWRADRKIGVDGLFVIAGLTLVFQDAITNWISPWITWNAYMVNFGTWYNDVPGWMSFGEPGRQVPEPLLFIPFGHSFAWLMFAIVGRRVIVAVRQRRPGIGYSALMAITFSVSFVLDVILEGIVWMPFGVYQYPGGHVPLLFPDAYHKLPLQETLFIAFWGVGLIFLYTFRNDKGQTIVERGVEKIHGGPVKKAGYQILAMIAAFHIGLGLLFTVPNLALWGGKSTEWPKDLQSRSYMVDNLCGPGSDWACPGPNVPLNYGNGRDQTGARIAPGTRSGNGVTIPGGGQIPEAVPFDTEPRGPFTGPMIRFGS